MTWVQSLIPGARRRDETAAEYLQRITSGSARGGPLIDRELARIALTHELRLLELERHFERGAQGV